MTPGIDNAALLVALLSKEGAAADVAKKVIGGLYEGTKGALKGTYRTVGAGTRAAGQEASRSLGGGLLGETAKGAIRVAPWVVGAGVANVALDDPVGKMVVEPSKAHMQQQVARLRARLAGTRAVWDPQRNMMI